MKPKAYSYLRFSHPSQSLGDSERRQIELSQQWAARNKVTLDDTVIADKGVSGWKGKNAAIGMLANFLQKVENGSIPSGSFLIIEHIDRLTRQSVRKALDLWFRLLDAGISIVTVDPERIYSPSSANDPLGLIEPILYFAVNNEKSERLSARLKETWQQKRAAQKPLTKTCPNWLKLDGDKFVLIEEHAKIIRQIVKWNIEGYGDLRICQKLNKAGIKVISKRKG